MASVCHFLPYRGQMASDPCTAPRSTDVAEAAGVAASTVSRAFSRPQRVNHRTREHVLRVAERARLRAQPDGPGARVGADPHDRAAGPGHHQPLLLRGDQGRRASRGRGGTDAGARGHRREPDGRGRAGTPARTCRGRVRDQRLPTHRRGAACRRGAQPDHAGQPGHCRARVRGGRLRLGDQADRRPPGVVRPPVVRLRRRTRGVVVRRPSVAGTPDRGRGEGMETPEVRSLHADARRRSGGRRRCCRVGGDRRGVPQRHAGHRGHAPAGRAWPVGSRTT